MNESIAELTRLGYRIAYFPYGEGVIGVQINPFGDASRCVLDAVTVTDLPKKLAATVAMLKAGNVPDDYWKP